MMKRNGALRRNSNDSDKRHPAHLRSAERHTAIKRSLPNKAHLVPPPFHPTSKARLALCDAEGAGDICTRDIEQMCLQQAVTRVII